ncbi:hypothetical protein A2U01_0082582, partial [Trifolium medium]|nr:hypothetical protein [Trifolium medium]
MTVAEYAAKFESLSALSPYYNTVEAEYDKCVKFESGFDKCVKFESGLRPEVKHLIGFSEIRDFPTL